MRPRLMVMLFAFFIAACSANEGTLEILNAWARPADAGMNTAAYFVIKNQGEQDRLIAADSTIAGSTEIHRSYMDDAGVMRMQQQESVLIPANAQVTFEPGGLHVMFIELKQDLIPDDQFQLRLYFERHGEVVIDVPIKMP
jgi:copper(I)-binding protein